MSKTKGFAVVRHRSSRCDQPRRFWDRHENRSTRGSVSVTGNSSISCRSNIGKKDPREPRTFPKRTEAIAVPLVPYT